jgi:hypothetical protein
VICPLVLIFATLNYVDEDQWIDGGYDTDASQENDEANNPTTANEEPIDEARGEDMGDDYGNGEHLANVTDWTFAYR